MNYIFPGLLAVATFFLGGCTQHKMMQLGMSEEELATTVATNPLLQPWNTPYGAPPFNEIQSEHYLPAILAGMQLHSMEIQAITAQQESPDFDNVILALERSGAMLNRTTNVFFAVRSSDTNTIIRATAKKIAPLLARHYNDITTNKALYEGVAAVYKQMESLNLTAEQRRLIDLTHKQFLRSGIHLSDEKQGKAKKLEQEIASLSEQFDTNLLAETNDFELLVDKAEDLGDLPENLVAVSAEKAAAKGHPGKWLFGLQRPSIDPFLQYSPNRTLRQKIFAGYANRSDNDNKNDNKAILLRIIKLRAERARLLGYNTHADYVLSDNVAENAENVMQLLDRVWKPALKVAIKERAALAKMLADEGYKEEFRASDWHFYVNKVRKERYDYDENELRPYLEVNAVRDGLFKVTTKLWGITYHPRNDIAKWHQDQQVFEVKEADGRSIGIVYLDFFIRESKRGGAWMSTLRAQNRLNGEIKPIVATTFNFPPPTENSPSLISFREAETVFHEFGHAIHGLFSNVTYPSLAGTALPRDFVEYPSQVMENWLGKPEVIKEFARHYQTGELIPDALIQKALASTKFNQGFETVEYMAAVYLDMAWHTLAQEETLQSSAQDPRQFEQQAMQKIGLIKQIIPRYRSGYFAHIFVWGYSSGYYGYLWSELFDADTFAAFEEKGIFNQEVATRLRTEVLSRGNSRPGVESFRAFRGRDPETAPLLKRRGLL